MNSRIQNPVSQEPIAIDRGVYQIQSNDVHGYSSTFATFATQYQPIDAKPSQLGDLEGEVGFVEFFVSLPLLVIHDVVHHAVHFLVRQCRHVDALHVAVDTDHRRDACGKMQVGRVDLDGKRE